MPFGEFGLRGVTLISENRQVVKDARERAINIKIYQNGGRKMKRKIFSILFALVLVLSLSLVTAVPVMANGPTEVWVDDDFTSATSTWGTTHFDKIQDGIDAVAPGGTVNVAPGTYTEDLVVNKANLTLKSVSGADNTTIQLVDGVGIDLMAGADNFVLGGATDEGFTVQSSSGAGTTFNIQLANAPSGVEISYNTIDTTGGATMGISVGAAGASGLTVSNNTFTAEDGDGSIWGPDVVDVTVSNNSFTGPTSPTSGYAVELSGVDGATISGNTIDGYGMGVFVFGAASGCGTTAVSDVTISGNTISGCSKGIRLGHSSQTSDMTTVTVTENTLSTNTVGIYVGDGTHVLASNFTINNNNISGNTNFGLENAHTSEQVTATHNWWDDASGPGGVGPGSGDAVSVNVDYAPWLGAGVAAAKTETTQTDDPDTVDATTEADVEVIKSGSGTPTISVVKYADNPGTGFSGDIGKYIDVHIDDTTNVTEIEIWLYYTNAEIEGLNELSLKLYWWDGSDWTECSDSGVNPADTNSYSGYIWAKIRGDTTPDLDDLTGTPFGGGGSPPIVGGTVLPVDKLSILMPWIGLAVALALAGVFITRFARRKVRG